jgi:sec-independent protein translocase protein TatA
MFGMGPWELLLIFLAVLLLFGAKRLPEIAQGLGKGIKEFKGAMKDTTSEFKNAVDDVNAPTPPKTETPPPSKEENKDS